MPTIDHHGEPFDDGTIAKLEIFEHYAEAWIPTFIMARGTSELYIFDFFAGPGYDSSGTPGSAIRLLRQVERFKDILFKEAVTIHIVFNEFERGKFEQLKSACRNFIDNNPNLNRLEIHGRLLCLFENKGFEEIFLESYPAINKYPCLVYCDQNGVKFLGKEYISKLASTRTTDFLYFAASSYCLRFGNRPEFGRYLSYLDMEALKKDGAGLVHRNLCKQIKDSLLSERDIYLFPFSIKKNGNVYGILFGSQHPRGADKFLDIVWKQNSINGEANFDLDEDMAKDQLSLFGERKLKKVELFEKNVRSLVLAKKICNNADLLHFAYSEGHRGEQAGEIVKRLKIEGYLGYPGRSPKVNYSAVYLKSKRDLVEFEVYENKVKN